MATQSLVKMSQKIKKINKKYSRVEGFDNQTLECFYLLN